MEGRAVVSAGMGFVIVCMGFCRVTKQRPFKKKSVESPVEQAFTLIELLVVISIIGILTSIILPSLTAASEKARLARAKEELQQLAVALELYVDDHNGAYPPDVNRGIPPGLQAYLPAGNWPNAPWPGSVYDWDNWAPSNLAYPPQQQVYQISIRFCTSPSTCSFPDESWAANFDYYSSAYYCVSGPCRAHSAEPMDHPAYCMNCSNNSN